MEALTLGEVLRFEQVAREKKLVFLHIAPGTVVQPGGQSMLVQEKDGAWCLRAYPPWEEVEIGGDGEWYAVNYSRISQQIGFADLSTYVISSVPGQYFRLGFHADMSIRASHVQGFSSWMQNRGSMTMLELLHTFKGSMRAAVAQALETVMGPGVPELRQIKEQKSHIEEEAESALFWLLYRNGLCLKPQSFLIRGLAPPMMQ